MTCLTDSLLQVWVAALGATVEPLCQAVGAVFNNCRATGLVQSA